MEPFYSISLGAFEPANSIPSVSDLTTYSIAKGYANPPSTNLNGTPAIESGATCAKCGGVPKHRCAACAEGVDIHGKRTPTFYCGKACQHEHWQTSHKAECKAANYRKQLYRAGAVLQPVFECMRRFTWHDNLDNVKWVEENGGKKLLARFGGEKTQVEDYYEFSRQLMVTDTHATSVLFAHGSGKLAVEILSGMLRRLLQGMSDKIEIQEYGTRIEVAPVVQPWTNDSARPMTDNHDLHWFFAVKLPDGDHYAIDLCTAQFTSDSGNGPWTCIAPLHEHIQRLTLGHDHTTTACYKELGFHSQFNKHMYMQGSSEEALAGVIYQENVCAFARAHASSTLEEANQHWMNTRSMTLGKALKLPETEFIHTFCTIVWPIQLMSARLREDATERIVRDMRHAAQNSYA